MGKTVLQLAVENAQNASNRVNGKISELGGYTSKLFTALTNIQNLFDKIRNIPSEEQFKLSGIKKTIVTWKQQVEKIESDYDNIMSNYKGSGAVGASLGVGVAALGPTAAMGFATTFGVASTGAAISTLSGAAATNAALAWLGGGAVVAGGGGIAAGNALLTLAGPVGWGIAAVSVITSGFFLWKAKNEKKRLENIYKLISERDAKKYNMAILEINERIKHITIELQQIIEGIDKIKTFGYNYRSMTSEQQYLLGAYVLLMQSASKLLVNPILGLQPSYTENDFNAFCKVYDDKAIFVSLSNGINRYKNAIISLANLLYNVTTDYDDREVLGKSFAKNDEFLKSLGFTKDSYPSLLLPIVNQALDYKYHHPTPKAANALENYQERSEITDTQCSKKKIQYTLYQVENIVKGTIIQELPKRDKPDYIYNSNYLVNLGVHVGTICAKLENTFGITISAEDVRSMNKVEDIIRVVRKLL